MADIQDLSKIMNSRRSIFPVHYIEKEIDNQLINAILINGNQAPNHKKTRPWRLIVFKGQEKMVFGNVLATKYKEITGAKKIKQAKHDKIVSKFEKSNVVIAICMQLHSDVLLEWEETATVACAVQNMWLSCTALNIGCYWSTPPAVFHLSDFLKLKTDQKCLGLFYMGYHKAPETPHNRGSIDDHVQWPL